jgi:large subunit ribosomal protein L10
MSATTVSKTKRTHYPKRKQKLYQQLQQLPKTHSVIALSNMTKVRAAQLMNVRKKFHNEILIKIIKNKVSQKAFETVTGVEGLERLSTKLEGQCALMFTNVSPFKLNLIFDKNRVYMAAKAGDVTRKDIVVSSGNTGLSPGPVLSEFKQANVPTKIDQGTIWVTKDTIVARAEDTINEKTAALLSKLNIKPIEAGISVKFAISQGLVFEENDLRISLKEYAQELTHSYLSALSLAIESVYLTSESVKPILLKGFQYGETLALASGYISSSTVARAVSKLESEAQTIARTIRQKGYTVS